MSFSLRITWILLLWILHHPPFYLWGCLAQITPSLPNSTLPCPRKCVCSGFSKEWMVDCSGLNLTSVPANLSRFTTRLDLGMNNISRLPENIFWKLGALKELRLASNHLRKLPRHLFRNTPNLETLWLQGNRFTVVPSRAIQRLDRLLELKLETNMISVVPPSSFRNMRSLMQLSLDTNNLTEVPVAALSRVRSLEGINLNENRIKVVHANSFANNTHLEILLMTDNAIVGVHDDAFTGLSNLRILEVQRNNLKKIPVAFKSLTSLQELNINDNLVEYLPDNSFSENSHLKILQLKGNPIVDIGSKAFNNLPRVQKITLSEARDMTVFPDLQGSRDLDFVRFDRAGIKVIPNDLCTNLPKLKTLDVQSNRVTEIPDLLNCSHLLDLNLCNNEITSLEGQPFRGLHQLTDLSLCHNYITHIPEDAFVGLNELLYLDLSKNKIKVIHDLAFLPLHLLEDLNIGENHISTLPTKGLENLSELKTYPNTELREFPPKEMFPKITSLVLSYAYHCCDFQTETNKDEVKLTEEVVWMKDPDGNIGTWHYQENSTQYLDALDENSTLFLSFGAYDELLNTLDGAGSYTDNLISEDFRVAIDGSSPSVTCKPKPGPFMPCSDLFGWWSLRCGVWFVFMLAVAGNGVVLFVSVTSRSKMDVPRFLICNLACADFFMGIYLGFLAIVDASTLGEFKKHAIWWQLSPGCVIAGFLGVLSSELSVFTLAVITLERLYAITHAMQLNKRLSLRHASYIMTGGWGFSMLIASLPIFGVSDFRKFAVCLPFEISGIISKGYVCFIMIFNGIAFFIILTCYFIMYLSIRDSQAWNSNDMRVAKRMALLVFTDFVCWAPIAFLSLAAAFGKNLIQLNEAKVLTIFILPLNSCANPFLYAIFTKQFKKDCVLLCRRLEDSSIARHFSRVSNHHGCTWASSRMPSGLNSLVPGEKRGSNSNSMSIGSQYAGLVNYNSENSGKLDSDRSDYDMKNTDHRLQHECPYCACQIAKEYKIMRIKKRDAECKKYSVKGVGEPQIILHQEFSSKDKSDEYNCTTETYLTSDGEDDRFCKTVKMKQNYLYANPTCSCCCTERVMHPQKGKITLPVVAFQSRSDKLSYTSGSKGQKKTPWTQNIPCCNTESSPVDTDKHCEYDAIGGREDSNGSSDRCIQCCSAVSSKSKSRSGGKHKSKQKHLQYDIQLVMEDGTQMMLPSHIKYCTSDDRPDVLESSFTESKRRQSNSSIEVNCEHGDSFRHKGRKKEKIDKNVHLRFFTQSLVEHDFIQSSVCRSNSLVELTQPQLVDMYHPPNKRFSLTPGQEGYMLLNRDSAFVDDDDVGLDFSNKLLDGYEGGSFLTRRSAKRRQTAQDVTEKDEASELLYDTSSITDDSRPSAEGGSCDKESGFVSEV